MTSVSQTPGVRASNSMHAVRGARHPGERHDAVFSSRHPSHRALAVIDRAHPEGGKLLTSQTPGD
jgi:hypothetical protein